MSNPNGGKQPDTYNSPLPNGYWDRSASPSVHTNSGVQNYWFYLLSQGGSGTNDLGNSFNVTGIGINQARQIAYRNLVTHLSANATYMDCYFGSLLATQSLYGNPSIEYTAVKNAWYAVGIGNNPNSYCSGTTNLTVPSGTITDGSGLANYNNNANCEWVIAPAGATQISLSFTAFDTEATYDIVTVYDGPDDTYAILATWWGNILPPTISTSAGVGAMCVKFTSDATTTNAGWSANYTSVISTPACSGVTMLTTPSGSFTDGSGTSNYTNNQQCYWYIAPPCATSVTLSFSSFNTELNFDGVVIYDDLSGGNIIGTFTGTTLPASITSNTGKMLIAFVSDYSTPAQGFSASYSSIGSSYCAGVTTINTADYGTISDGSGNSNYCNNSSCSWLIQPPQATTVTLNFTAFELEAASLDGNSIYDVVEVYDGTSSSAALLGRFTGNNLPSSITSTGGSLFVRFFSDYADAYQGWEAYYTSTQNPYCNGTASTLTASSSSFNDGSASNNYANNSNCSWLIQPPSASSITLSFSAFDTELDYDGVIVFDGADDTAPIIGQYTGTTLPSSATSTGGSMYVLFLSDETLRSNGWNANYNSTTLSNSDFELNGGVIIYPNPFSNNLTIEANEPIHKVEIYNMLGQLVKSKTTQNLNENLTDIDLSELAQGNYLAKIFFEQKVQTVKLIKK
jgi:hypothetical protein